jgi:hypothetical protein
MIRVITGRSGRRVRKYVTTRASVERGTWELARKRARYRGLPLEDLLGIILDGAVGSAEWCPETGADPADCSCSEHGQLPTETER